MAKLNLKELQVKLSSNLHSPGVNLENMAIVSERVDIEIVKPIENSFKEKCGIEAIKAKNRDDFNDIVKKFIRKYCEMHNIKD